MSKPRRLGDGLLFVVVFSMILMMFLALGYSAQESVTKPVEVSKEIHELNSSQEEVQLDHVYQGCLEGSVEAWNPNSSEYLEKPFDYSVSSYSSCTVDVSGYNESGIGFSYVSKQVDSGSVYIMGGVVDISLVFIAGVLPIALIVIFVLFAPRFIEYIQIGGSNQ